VDLTRTSLSTRFIPSLVVIGQRELQELRGYASPERLLLSSGAPILVIPSGRKSECIGSKILVGWNASREAPRAVQPAFIGGAVHFLSLTLNYATSGAVAVLVMSISNQDKKLCTFDDLLRVVRALVGGPVAGKPCQNSPANFGRRQTADAAIEQGLKLLPLDGK
jgi:hypothetical protein